MPAEKWELRSFRWQMSGGKKAFGAEQRRVYGELKDPLPAEKLESQSFRWLMTSGKKALGPQQRRVWVELKGSLSTVKYELRSFRWLVSGGKKATKVLFVNGEIGAAELPLASERR